MIMRSSSPLLMRGWHIFPCMNSSCTVKKTISSLLLMFVSLLSAIYSMLQSPYDGTHCMCASEEREEVVIRATVKWEEAARRSTKNKTSAPSPPLDVTCVHMTWWTWMVSAPLFASQIYRDKTVRMMRAAIPYKCSSSIVSMFCVPSISSAPLVWFGLFRFQLSSCLFIPLLVLLVFRLCLDSRASPWPTRTWKEPWLAVSQR